MKKIVDRFCEGLQFWPIFRIMCVIGLLLSIGEAWVLAFIHQSTGVIPSTQGLNLILCYWNFPVGISRLWDFLLLPLFVYIAFINEHSRDEKSYESDSSENDLNELTGTQFALCVAMMGSTFFGIVYAVPIFVVSCVLWIITCLLWGMIRNMI